MVVSSADQLNSDENGEPFRWVSEKHFLFVFLWELTVLPRLKGLRSPVRKVHLQLKNILPERFGFKVRNEYMEMMIRKKGNLWT